MDQDWHSGHFSCWNCDMSLTGHRYILREEHPYCIKCYENLFANTCEECKTTIGTDSKVAYNNNNNKKITSVPTKALETKLRGIAKQKDYSISDSVSIDWLIWKSMVGTDSKLIYNNIDVFVILSKEAS